MITFKKISLNEAKELIRINRLRDAATRYNPDTHIAVPKQQIDFTKEIKEDIAEIKEALAFLKIAYDSKYAKKLAEEKEKPVEAIKFEASQKRKASLLKLKSKHK